MAEQFTIAANHLSTELPGIPVVDPNEASFYPTPSAQDGVWLPLREAWLIDPRREKLETPYDPFGVVDMRRLLTDINATLADWYVWPRWSINAHHFQWPSEEYSHEPIEPCGVVPAVFRNLPNLKAVLPRVLENWIHLATLPPIPPAPDVMKYHVDSWRATQMAFICARALRKLPRSERRRQKNVLDGTVIPSGGDEDPVARAYFSYEQSKYEYAYDLSMNYLDSIPREIRLLNPGMSPKTVTAKVGRLALQHSHQLSRIANRAS